VIVDKDLMFFCIPQQAYLRTGDCASLRDRPVGRAPAGSQPRLKACEFCTMYPLVENLEVPTVSLRAYIGGARPAAAKVESASAKSMFAASKHKAL
jgi:hypothetical protein